MLDGNIERFSVLFRNESLSYRGYGSWQCFITHRCIRKGSINRDQSIEFILVKQVKFKLASAQDRSLWVLHRAKAWDTPAEFVAGSQIDSVLRIGLPSLAQNQCSGGLKVGHSVVAFALSL